jgi:hypothetical protein
MNEESTSDWLRRVGPIAARQNEESRRENAREESRRLATIRTALELTTLDLCRTSREQLVKLLQQLASRVTCELWGEEMGWAIPAYGTPEWQELYTAWLSHDD